MSNQRAQMNLQTFAAPGGEPPALPTPPAPPAAPPAPAPAVDVDYQKIADLVDGKLAATQDSVIKGYLKQQGLTREQMDQAIATFKQQQEANKPDVNALQEQLTRAQEAARKAAVDNAAVMAAVSLGLDARTIPYVLKMADFGQAMGEDGKINDDALKNALNKVLEDVPALKPQASGTTGFMQVGAAGAGGQQQTTDDALKKAFGL